jgi:uncharacterized membrane protein YfcA
MELHGLVIIGFLAVLGETVDSSLGMMYGTILSPILIAIGHSPELVVPSILISQASGGIVGTLSHHRQKNINLNGITRDIKISLAIVIPGLLACAIGVVVGQIIPKLAMSIYIGVLVIIMGILCLRPIYYSFSWKKMWGVGLLSGFNKALSGGGFGPVTSTGKMLSGVDAKVSISTTTLAEVPICLFSFILWLGLGEITKWSFPVALSIGAIIGGFIGPTITARLNIRSLRTAVGILAVASGVWLLINVLV